MTAVVVDASVILKVYVNEKDSPRALALIERRDLAFEAPDLLPIEVTNALIRREKDELLPSTIIEQALEDLPVLLPYLTPTSLLLEPAITIARALLHHPIYDCIYLALAESLNVPFVTADEKLIKQCRAHAPSRPFRIVSLIEFVP